jgi:hypothetical protein
VTAARVGPFLLGALAAACGADAHRPGAPIGPGRETNAVNTVPSIDERERESRAPSIASGWLRVVGTKILRPDGAPFRGRGANIHDTRSCDACSFEPPHVEEVTRRIDVLVDEWHATFLRLLLESYPDRGPGRAHYKNVEDDDDYFHDVMRIVGHIGKKPGVYVMVSLWQDPTFSPLGWPTERTRAVWRKLARALRDIPYVLFGLVNEPEKNDDGRLDGQVWRAMNDTVAAIREVENPERRHLVAVQGTREWGRVLDYYIDHPITAGGGVNVVYETHPYDRKTRFASLVERPAHKLPVIIGEFGAQQDKDVTMFPEDCVALMDLAERLDIPWLAWTFHPNCPPNLLVRHEGSCGVGLPLLASEWGRLVKERLAHEWK